MAELGVETARVHVLDRKYLRPLKVLHYSLMKHGSLRNCPVIIITNDSKVASDPFIQQIAERVIFLTEKDLSHFGGIRGDRINQRVKPTFAPKYTFLKLSVLRPMGFQRHVVLDCDMICLSPLDEALLSGPEDVKAVREYGRSVFPQENETRPADFPARSLACFERFSHAESMPMQKNMTFNSGVLVLQGRAISEGLFEAAVRLGENEAFEGEQGLTYEALRRAGASYLRLPIFYNARRRVFQSLGEEFFERRRNEVRILHFTPGKPWNMQESEHRAWDRLWIAYEKEALEAHV